jgi:hypothetical protein
MKKEMNGMIDAHDHSDGSEPMRAGIPCDDVCKTWVNPRLGLIGLMCIDTLPHCRKTMLNDAQEGRLVGSMQEKAMMSHGAADVAAVEDPAESLGKGIRGVERAGDVL